MTNTVFYRVQVSSLDEKCVWRRNLEHSEASKRIIMQKLTLPQIYVSPNFFNRQSEAVNCPSQNLQFIYEATECLVLHMLAIKALILSELFPKTSNAKSGKGWVHFRIGKFHHSSMRALKKHYRNDQKQRRKTWRTPKYSARCGTTSHQWPTQMDSMLLLQYFVQRVCWLVQKII